MSSETSVSSALKKLMITDIEKRFKSFLQKNLYALPAKPAMILNHQDVLAIPDVKEAIFFSYFCEGNPWGEMDMLRDFEIETAMDMVLFGIYFRKTQNGDLKKCSPKAQDIMKRHPSCAVFVIPETLQAILSPERDADKYSPHIIFTENPFVVVLDGEMLEIFEAIKRIGNHPLLPTITQHISNNYEAFSTQLF